MIAFLKTNVQKYLVEKIGIDRAISFTLGYQVLGAVRSIISLILVARFLTPNEQGFFYTFASITAIQIFFELGFSGIITQYVAHEKAHLLWVGDILKGNEKNKSRLSSLLHLSCKWFGVMSIILFFVLVGVGYIFFFYFSPQYSDVEWQIPWILLSLGTAIGLFVSPFLSFYEGLGKVTQIASVRFYVNLIQLILLVVFLYIGVKLYVAALVNMGALLMNIFWLNTKEIKTTLLDIWDTSIDQDNVSWREEIFPYQWKIALSWMSGYFIFQLFNPILFSTAGAVVAGQMGMTQSLINGVYSISFSWISTKIPTFSMLIAQKNYNSLDSLFNASLYQSLAILSLLSFVLFIIAFYASNNNYSFIFRFLPIIPFAIMQLSTIPLLITVAMATYLRCHKEEPFLINSIVLGILNVIIMIYTSTHFGVLGMTVGYSLNIFLGLLWAYSIFNTKKRLRQ